MTRDIEAAQRSYDAVLDALHERQDRQPTASTTNVTLLAPAIEPVEAGAPEGRPDRRPVGDRSACCSPRGIVYVLEMLDRRVRSRYDLESRLAVPSLGRLSKWQPTGGRLLPAPMRAARALPQPW